MRADIIAKRLVLFVIVRTDGATPAPCGLLYVNGPDRDAAKIVASKRWRVARAQVQAIEWDAASYVQRHDALMAELRTLQGLLSDAVDRMTPAERRTLSTESARFVCAIVTQDVAGRATLDGGREPAPAPIIVSRR